MVPYEIKLDEGLPTLKTWIEQWMLTGDKYDNFELSFDEYSKQITNITANQQIILRNLQYWFLRRPNLPLKEQLPRMSTYVDLQNAARTSIEQVVRKEPIKVSAFDEKSLFNAFGGAPSESSDETTSETNLPPPPDPKNPQDAVKNAQLVLKELQLSKKELNVILTAITNAVAKFKQFNDEIKRLDSENAPAQSKKDDPQSEDQSKKDNTYEERRKALDSKIAEIEQRITGLRGEKGDDKKVQLKQAETDLQTARTDLEKLNLEKERGVTGAYSYMNEEGKQIIAEIQKLAEDQKANMRKIFNRLTKIIEREPNHMTDRRFIEMSSKLSEAVEGKLSGTSESKGFINDISSWVTDITSAFNAQLATVKRKAQGIKEEREFAVRKAENQRYLPAQYAIRPQAGGAPLDDAAIQKIINTSNANIKMILDSVITPLEALYKTRMNPAFALANSISPMDNLFTKLMFDYKNARDTDDITAKQNLVTAMRANNLLPEQVLAVTTQDKTIFVFLTLFIRLFALSIVEFLIERGTVKRMFNAVVAYLVLFTLIFVAFALFVNLDMYRLRVVFNYINFHQNAGYFYTYIVLLWTLGAFMFLIMYKLNFPVSGFEITAISEEEKIQLISRLEILTMIVWVILSIIVAVS